uniref:BCL2-associated athanogene 6 n=1 Tax=Anopheles coluzzii TaxID=1518534 RepID=A0A8W7P4V4_ANOCL
MINLKVKTLDSQNHDFTVDEEISVRQFKEQIADKISVSVELQRLIYCGRVLSDDVPLKNYDLNGKVVHLVQRPPPSARGTSLSTSESGGRDEGARASRRSRSSDNASRTIFPSLDELNTMYFGSMTSIPLNMTSTNVTQIPSVGSSSTLCNNRITVARHMLDCADSILSYLENPARGLNYSAMDYLSQQTMESTVFEVGISAVGDVDIPHNQVQSFVNAFQGAVSAALRQNGMSNVTVQQPDGLNGSVQVFGTVPDFATTSTQTLGEVVQQMRSVQRRMEPFLQQYYDILQDDPAFEESDTVGRENAQRVFDRVSEAMHYISHAQHAISDLMLDLQMTTPRHLCCRPILVEQNAYVSSGMAAMPQNINLANLLRNHINVNNNNNNNNNPEVGNNNIHAQLINLGITAQPTFFAAAGGGAAPGATAGAAATANNTMRPPSSAPSGGGTTAAPSTTAPNGAAATNNTTAQPRPPNLGQSQSRPPMAAVGGGVSGVGGGGGGGVRGSDNMVTSVFIPLYDLNSVRRLEHVLQAQPVPVAGWRDNPVIIMRELLHPRAPRTASADGRLQPPSATAGSNTRNRPTATATTTNCMFLPCNSHHIRDNTGSNGDRSSEGTPNRTGSGETTANTPNAAPPSTEGGSDTVPMQDDVRTAAAATRVNMFGTQLTMGDLQNLVPNPNTLNRIREPLRSYVNRALFTPDREVDEQTVREAGERIINNVMPMLVPVVDIESPEFDTRASLANLMRSTFPSFINLVREDSSSQFGVRLMRLLLTFLRRSFMILIRGVGRERSLMAVSTLVAFALRLHNVPEPERLVRLLIRPTLENNFAAAARHDMFDIQQFLVIRQPAPESAAATGAAAAAAAAPGTATTADGSESLSSSSMSSSTGTSSGQREASPMDVDEAETMSTPELVSDIAEISISIEPPAMSVDPADTVPTSSSSDAGPATGNDGELSVTGDRTPQPAEAPAQEVPIVTCSLTGTDLDFANRPVPPPRPAGDDEELPTVEYDAESWHRHFPSNWLPIITRDLGRQRRQMSYCEAMKASIRDRLAKDTDYDAMRFPNCSKYFEK